MPRTQIYLHIAGFLSFCIGTLGGYGAVSNQERELDILKRDIVNYEQQISQNKEKERNLANLISSLDRKIDVTSNVLYDLSQQVREKDVQIKERQREIRELEDKINKIRQVMTKRLVSFYKYGQRRDFEVLLAGGSWQRVNVWLKYQKLVAQNDRRNYESLVAKVEKLKQDQQLLQGELFQKERLLQDQESHARQLKQSRSKREKYLDSVRRDREYMVKHVRELQTAQQEIHNYISESEKQRVNKQRQISHKRDQVVRKPTREYSFSSMRGRLPWPARGTVVTHFGSYRHPTLRTVTENLGIEIKAPLGADVMTVDTGQVQTITWQRGRGNIIIISHDDGFYTVYTHLAEIRVNPLDYVQRGQVIGTVGESGSLNGPVLHFQIWRNTENLNPEDWLG